MCTAQTTMDKQHLRINVSRSPIEKISAENVTSLGASYTHIKTLKGVIGKDTEKVVMYHAFLDSLEGFEDAQYVALAYLGFNQIKKFRPEDKNIPKIGVLDLAGNPIESLENSPPCEELIISSTLVKNLFGAREGTKIIRCGHSTHLLSLEGCPSSVEIIECSCAPNLVVQPEHIPKNCKEIIIGHN